MLGFAVALALTTAGEVDLYALAGGAIEGPIGSSDSPPASGGFSYGVGAAYVLQRDLFAFVPHVEFQRSGGADWVNLYAATALIGVSFEHVRFGVGPALYFGHAHHPYEPPFTNSESGPAVTHNFTALGIATEVATIIKPLFVAIFAEYGDSTSDFGDSVYRLGGRVGVAL